MDRPNTMQEPSSTAANAEKDPAYARFVVSIRPVMRGPIVWPMSIVMSRKPMAVPVSFIGARSLTKAGVEEVTIAKPIPYITDRSSRTENRVEK